jgi:hypothetical protein
MKKTERIYTMVLSLAFVCWISVPLVWDSLINTRKALISKTENRMLARRPKLKLTNPGSFPAAYEKYYNDHFFLRYELIHLNTLVIGYYLFNNSPIPNEVAFGKHGWFFATAKEREVYDGRFNLPDDFVEALVTELHSRALKYQQMGISFYMTVVPMKSEIYPEFLPDYYIRTKKPTFTERVLARIRNDTLVRLIELKDSLLQTKKEGLIFYRTDSHWNGLGAWYAYSFLINRIRKDFPAITPVKRSDFILAGTSYSTGNLATLAGLHDFIHEMMFGPRILHPSAAVAPKHGYKPPPRFGYPGEYEMVSTTNNKTLPRIVVIRDSFFFPLMGLFNENFDRSVYIFDAWKYGPNYKIIENEKPDIVLLEVYEAHLSNVLSSLSL